jgi:hypothetical protein
MTVDPQPATPSVAKPRKAASVGGQVVAVVGIGVCIVLAIVVLLARGWAVNQVDSISTSIDDALGRGIPALQAADERVTQMGSTVQEVADAATAVATSDAVVAPAVAQALSTRLSSLSERYTPIRAAYADAHSQLVSALDRVQTITRFLPGVTVPQAPIDALSRVDEAIRAVDDRITAILEANRAGTAIRESAQRVADAAPAVQTALDNVSTRFTDAEARLNEARADVTDRFDRIRTLITIVALLVIALLVYIAALHVVLLRFSGGLRRGGGGSTA